MAGFDLRPIQRLIQQAGELPGGGVQAAQNGFLMGSRTITFQHMQHAGDCIERGADLMAHDREKIVLGARGFIGAAPGFFQRADLIRDLARHPVEGCRELANLIRRLFVEWLDRAAGFKPRQGLRHGPQPVRHPAGQQHQQRQPAQGR